MQILLKKLLQLEMIITKEFYFLTEFQNRFQIFRHPLPRLNHKLLMKNMKTWRSINSLIQSKKPRSNPTRVRSTKICQTAMPRRLLNNNNKSSRTLTQCCSVLDSDFRQSGSRMTRSDEPRKKEVTRPARNRYTVSPTRRQNDSRLSTFMTLWKTTWPNRRRHWERNKKQSLHSRRENLDAAHWMVFTVFTNRFPMGVIL